MTFLIMYKIRNAYRMLKNERIKDKKIAGMMQLSSNHGS